MFVLLLFPFSLVDRKKRIKSLHVLVLVYETNKKKITFMFSFNSLSLLIGGLQMRNPFAFPVCMEYWSVGSAFPRVCVCV